MQILRRSSSKFLFQRARKLVMGYACCRCPPAIILATVTFEVSGLDNEIGGEAGGKMMEEEYAVADKGRN
jgi:hypothetical protein